MISEPNIAVKMYSWTGALIAEYYSNTTKNAVTKVTLEDTARNGFDVFAIELSNNLVEPVFTDIICKIFKDGILWASGYAEVIPQLDSFDDMIVITGKGWVHKLKTVVVNETYTTQTLDFIIRDLASTYLTTDLGINYVAGNIVVPVISALSMEFNDKTLWECFDTLLDIANFDYPNTNYRFVVGTAQNFVFNDITNAVNQKWFEGYQYYNPKVETISNKLVNKVLTYRTTSADDKATEFVAEYSDADSIANYGEVVKKITFSDYVIDAGIASIADSILQRYKEPLTRVTIENIDLDLLDIPKGKYKLANFRRNFFRTINNMESLVGWNVAGLSNSTASISTTEVYTNRTSMKLLSSVGSATDEMIYTVPEIIFSPTFFRMFAYKEEAGSLYTIALSDSYGNEVFVIVGGNNEPINEWIEYKIQINLELGSDTLAMDKNITTEDDEYVDKDISTEDIVGVDYLLRDGILNVDSIKIIVDSDIAATTYFDELSVEASVPVDHELYIESMTKQLGSSRLATVVFGDTQDSLIDEVKKNVKAGDTAFAVYSKT